MIAVHQAEKARKEREYVESLKNKVERLVSKAQSCNDNCETNLAEQLDNFEKYERLNKFINHMKNSIGDEDITLEIKSWFAWVEVQAQQLNPASYLNSFKFNTPKEILPQVESMIANDEGLTSKLKQIDLPKTVENILRWKSAYRY